MLNKNSTIKLIKNWNISHGYFEITLMIKKTKKYTNNTHK